MWGSCWHLPICQEIPEEESLPGGAQQGGRHHLPWQQSTGEGSPKGCADADVLIQGHLSAPPSCPVVGMLWGRSLRKILTTPWYYFCKQWVCFDCMKVRLALSLYPAISACDTRPEAYCSNVLRLHKYITEWLKHSWCIFSAFQKRGSSLWRFICCHF